MSIDNPETFSLAEKYRIMAVHALEISEIHERSGQWDEAVHLLQFMLKIADRFKDKGIEAKTRVLLGDLLWKRGFFDEARRTLEKAKQLAEEISEDKIVSDCFYHLGELYYVEASAMRNQDHTAAREYHEKALALRERVGDKKGVIQSLSRLGTILEHMQHYHQALEYHNKAIVLAEEITYEKGLYRPITHIGAFYQQQGDLNTALTHYQEHLKYVERLTTKRD